MTTGSQLHGARWPRFNCVQMIETMIKLMRQVNYNNYQTEDQEHNSVFPH